MSDLPLVRCSNLSLDYHIRGHLARSEKFRALDNIDLEIFPGERLGIIGGNGAGKSTLLRLLLGIYRPSTGSIQRNTSRISLLFINAGFDWNLNAFDNALFGAMLLGHSEKLARRLVPQIIEYSELGAFAHKPIKTFSSGMIARLGFSIATQAQTDLLLIDEVLAVGDEHFRNKAENTIQGLVNDGQSFVLVAHNNAQIQRLCKRVIWLEKGRIAADGSPSEVLSKYASQS